MNSINDQVYTKKLRVFSNLNLFFVTLCLMALILGGCLLTQRLTHINIFLLIIIYPISFFVAISSIKEISIKHISSITDPRIWLPISYSVYLLVYPLLSILIDSRYSSFRYEIPQIVLSTLLGIISLQLGLHTIRPIDNNQRSIIKLDRYSPFIIILITMAIGIYWWLWRIKHGFFFTHAKGYIPIVNVETGIRDVLGKVSLYVPTFILAFAYRNQLWNKVLSVSLFIVYSSAAGLLFLLSGAIRDFFWIFLLILGLSLYMLQPRKIKLISLGMVVLIAVVASISLVYSMRQLSNEILKSKRQFSYIVSNVSNIVGEGYKMGWFKETPIDRIFWTNQFFYKTVEAINENGSFGFGTYTLKTIPIVVPRILWPNKGIVADTEQIIQKNVLKDFEYDAGITPLTQFYAEGGFFGVIVGFFMLGLISSGIHKICFSIRRGISGLVFWVIVLVSIIQWEANIPISLLVGIRNAFIYSAFTEIIAFFFRKNIILESTISY